MVQIPIADHRKEIFDILNDFLLKDLSTLTSEQHISAYLQDDDDGHKCYGAKAISEELSNIMSVFDLLQIDFLSIGPFEKTEDLDPYIAAFSEKIYEILSLTGDIFVGDQKDIKLDGTSEKIDFSKFISEDSTEGKWKDKYREIIENLKD